MTWHVISNETGLVLGVYGSALLAEAQGKAAEIERKTGCPTYLHTGVYSDDDMPHVGQTISMRNTATRK